MLGGGGTKGRIEKVKKRRLRPLIRENGQASPLERVVRGSESKFKATKEEVGRGNLGLPLEK